MSGTIALGIWTAGDMQSHTIPLPPGRVLQIEVTVGNVRIQGESRQDAVVQITRMAPSPAGLARIPVDIEETPGTVAVRATQSDGATDPAFRTDVTLRVPHKAALNPIRILEGRLTVTGLAGDINADVRRGTIEATDLEGTVRLETGIGDIVARRLRLSPGGLLRLRTFNGDVRLTLAERPSHARIMALALNGTIRSDIPLRMKDSWGPRWGETTLGEGAPVISVDVITGAIDIRSP